MTQGITVLAERIKLVAQLVNIIIFKTKHLSNRVKIACKVNMHLLPAYPNANRTVNGHRPMVIVNNVLPIYIYTMEHVLLVVQMDM